MYPALSGVTNVPYPQWCNHVPLCVTNVPYPQWCNQCTPTLSGVTNVPLPSVV